MTTTIKTTTKETKSNEINLGLFPAFAGLATAGAKAMATGAIASLGAKAADKVLDNVFGGSPIGSFLNKNKTSVISSIQSLSIGELDTQLDLHTLETRLDQLSAQMQAFSSAIHSERYDRASGLVQDAEILVNLIMASVSNEVDPAYADTIAAVYTAVSQYVLMEQILAKASPQHSNPRSLRSIIEQGIEIVSREDLIDQALEQAKNSFVLSGVHDIECYGIGSENAFAFVSLWFNNPDRIKSRDTLIEYLWNLSEQALLSQIMQIDVIHQWETVLDNLDDPTIYEVMISAAMINPEGTDHKNEWISLINFSEADVDLSGWELQDYSGKTKILGKDSNCQNPMIVKSGESIVIKDLSPLRLTNTGDTIRLYDKQGICKHVVGYSEHMVKVGKPLSFLRPH